MLWDISDIGQPRAIKKVQCHQSINTNAEFDQSGEYLVTIGATGSIAGSWMVALWRVDELIKNSE